MLIDRKMNRTELKDASGHQLRCAAKMEKGKVVSMESLHKVCAALDCGIGDIVKFEKAGAKK